MAEVSVGGDDGDTLQFFFQSQSVMISRAEGGGGVDCGVACCNGGRYDAR